MTAMNLNRAIRGPVTAVPVVAGKGVRIVPDVENNRFVVEADETVLYYNSDGYTPGDGTAPSDVSVQLAESIMNFERIRINIGGKLGEVVEMLPAEATTSGSAYNHSLYISRPDRIDNTAIVGLLISPVENNSTKLRFRSGYSGNWGDAYRSGQDWGYYTLFKIIGINRIANN